MILSEYGLNYFKGLHSRIIQSMVSTGSKYPYLIDDDDFLKNYECIRIVWTDGSSVKNACQKFGISRSSYYKLEKRFVRVGLPGLFALPCMVQQFSDAEELILLAKKARPSLSYTSIYRIAQMIPLTKDIVTVKLIASVLQSHGYGISDMESDVSFLKKIQRKLRTWSGLSLTVTEGRDPGNRSKTFFSDKDICQKRLEVLRRLYMNPKEKVSETCERFGIPVATFYRVADDYKLYGPWAVIPARSDGKDGVSDELHLKIILEKLKNPNWTPEVLVTNLKLNTTRFVVHRIVKRWGIDDRKRSPVMLDEFSGKGDVFSYGQKFKPIGIACHQISETALLSGRRINRHFELICRKMKIRSFHICDPGPLLLAPFVNELGIVQAFESYGPSKLRGRDMTNLALLNVFRILAGYRRVNHLRNNRDRAVALASGVGMYGSTSKYYDDTVEFKFDQLHKLRCDLVARAKELGLIEGLHIGFDFHLKQFFGKHAREKNIGKGPNKSHDLVPGFRPHIVWDLAANVIISMAYYQGSTRAPRILLQFCEQNLYSLTDPSAIREIYTDSEYTKEGHFHYLKEVACKNGDIYICLRKNKQIKKLIRPALDESEGWEKHGKEDECKIIRVQLPKTKLDFVIVILRDAETEKNIRCFGSTNVNLSKEEILEKYRYRWVLENGIKDLIGSYFLDEINSTDPEKIEFEFYCVMIARLAYESFLKELGDKYLHNENGNKCTLQRMRNLLFEKRNCTIHLDNEENFVLTNFDSDGNSDIETDVSNMLLKLKEKNRNKVLWWGQRSILFRFMNQYK